VRYTDVAKCGYLDSIWTRNPLHRFVLSRPFKTPGCFFG